MTEDVLDVDGRGGRRGRGGASDIGEGGCVDGGEGSGRGGADDVGGPAVDEAFELRGCVLREGERGTGAVERTHLDRKVIDGCAALFGVLSGLGCAVEEGDAGAEEGDLFFLFFELAALFFDFFMGNALWGVSAGGLGDGDTYKVGEGVAILFAADHVHLLLVHCLVNGDWLMPAFTPSAIGRRGVLSSRWVHSSRGAEHSRG